MRYRILASFQGAPYEAGVGPDESDVVLFAACPPPEELRFEPATGHWRKRVSRSQVQTLYESRPVGMFRGERCIVLDDLSDRLHIVYLGHDALRAAQLGYWEVDRGVFELITPRHEVTDIVEQRLPLPIRSDSGHHTRPGPMPPERSDDYDALAGNSAPRSRDDSLPFRFGLPSGSSQDLPIASLSRSEPSMTRSADQSDVAIPPVPEPPLPLEAEALRAASSSARRERKSSQSRRPQPAVEPAPPGQPAPGQAQQPPAPVPQTPPVTGPRPPVAQAQAPVEPVQVGGAPADPVAAPQVPSAPIEAPEPATEVSQPLPAPVPAAAMLSKAAMLSHAAAMAARLAQVPDRRPDPPTSPVAASGVLSTHSEQESRPEDEAGLTPPAALAPEPAALAPEQDGVPATAEAATPTVQAADTAAYVDQPATEQEPVNEPADAQAHGSAGPGHEPLPDAPAAPPPATRPVTSPPVPPAADIPAVPVPAAVAPPAPVTDDLTSPEPAEPPQPVPAQPTPDDADGTAATPLMGISDPPSVAHPPTASAVPSWTPQGPVQPQPGFDFGQPTPQTSDYYAPYVASEPVQRNGIATANGAAAVVDLGLVAPTPIQGPVGEMPEPAAEAQAEPGTTTRRRRGTKRRLPTQKIFSDLATQAAIPAAAYAIGEEVDGAMCLVRTDEGFEVFNAAAGARHEVRVFHDEESAYFYLFGVLVAESVRTGALVPRD